MKTRRINKVLVANRGEIAIRVFRACTELGIRTVAIYSKEDTGSYHRYKADEAYLVGEGKKPIEAYLDIEGIIEIAKAHDVDAIHPGYGFLSENIQFAKRCREEGIIFIGPNEEHLDMFGDKVKARHQAELAGIPVIPGSDGPVRSLEEVVRFAETYGYPIIIKAALGGGGRGMRIVRAKSEVKEAFERAKSEAKAAFGSDDVYVEKLIEKPKHIEVQILGDYEGNIVHLYERDCSVQRRHQKVVEVAPSVSLSDELRQRICEAAVKLMKNVGYVNAGTVEFLVSGNDFYFIEVNPRIQVEHTITEMITGIDIVQSQILIADGYSLHSKEVGIPKQEDIRINGYAIQSRVTTEDPLNNFMPDTGKIMAYRSGGGFGVRLDAGNGFQGAVITPYYDSLLVKLSTWALTFEQAARKMLRNLREFRIRGIKTNIPFLENVVQHPKFLSGEYDTSFIDTTPELFVFPRRKDRGTKMLTYIGTVTVNGFPGIGKKKKPVFDKPRIPKVSYAEPVPGGTKQILDEKGPEGLVQWIKEQDRVLLTDTTFRDAHQSLLATRVRTVDLVRIAEPTARLLPNLFSLEMWGGATFDVAYRFLKEDPWDRLLKLRERIPNILFQMLLRSANAVGYKNYPDNVIREFVEKSAQAGIDVFRIFDSLNWVKGMTVAIDAVRQTGKIAEAAVCYTGDILDPSRPKYNLDYYKTIAKELEQAGAHILAIKDMAGLLKPEAAYVLISALKETVDIPIHLHTHDTSGNGIYMYAKAIEAGVDIVDVAVSSMAGLTSQPSANTLYYALEGTKRAPEINIHGLEQLSRYWEDVRKFYQEFESGMNSPHTEVYMHEMPGGQYSNLQQQAKAVGLGDRWDEVKEMYRRVNDLFGDIVKVTPSSKVVGDMALYMVQNNLTEQDIFERGETLDFPDSVVEFFEGYLGQPHGGFPKELQRIILKGREPITVRPGELLEPVDFDRLREELYHALDREVTDFDVLAYALYPKVFLEYAETVKKYGDISVLDTPTFLYGMRLGEEIEVEIEKGKTLIVKLVSIGQPQADGTRVVYFELNGQPREVIIRDESIKSAVVERIKADRANPNHIAATMPGTVVKVLVEKGEKVNKGDHLMITEAMKMETTVQAPFSGIVKDIYVKNGDAIQAGDLLIELTK
ncbi:pyruvate carboxylase [Saccharococcus caldoxylosilyticus]|uniref:Pyruvate carboxylase n=1 Tax=Saccharococcus caldoxylosilyticus TaxID=81408 RepID=A0A150L4R8_9BACL|nr:pyruvate carboxylase [Parageobacillus caldoxylosilyticus]KYD07297.1 Pyruvate carboxyl transferase [Parageobacillus caldoxylosilyticus]QXJ37524.1 2-oxoglutarate carboxylase small subunit [Parageobacillus caldoxylosilyticus]BDG35008.1 pyruvate carboxylase [Parageobacillus caldoxylosilyticus]BDG38782.1 pyruvate carboxylase [Parageobacillus caldoxylosilyticus]BDG42583.1 pyruvate carboxylase [Parageobacillus caldoxylosilyticus]